MHDHVARQLAFANYGFEHPEMALSNQERSNYNLPMSQLIGVRIGVRRRVRPTSRSAPRRATSCILDESGLTRACSTGGCVLELTDNHKHDIDAQKLEVYR